MTTEMSPSATVTSVLLPAASATVYVPAGRYPRHAPSLPVITVIAPESPPPEIVKLAPGVTSQAGVESAVTDWGSMTRNSVRVSPAVGQLPLTIWSRPLAIFDIARTRPSLAVPPTEPDPIGA